MRYAILILAFISLALPLGAAKDLEIYFVDVEGGQATLIVSPTGQSMLVDAGWPGNNARDANRIAAAMKLAGVKRIDFLLLTHYHLDHVGGIPDVVAKIPVVTFVDHGPNTESGKQAAALAEAYEKVWAKGKHLVVKPGDKIPITGLDVQVVTARGQKLSSPLKGAGAANPACEGVEPKETDRTENGQSVGFILAYGKFRFADLGDLTWNKELDLVCPNNLIGTANVYLVSHHGMNISNSPAIVQALHPKVAISNNGAKKGGSPEAWQTVHDSPGLEDLWQLHYAVAAGKDRNPPDQFVANSDPACQGNWIKLTARSNGSFTVTNGRNGFSKTYKP